MKNNRADSGAFIGVGGLVVALFLYGYTAIALPSWLHTLLMPLIWLALFVLGCVWFTPHPRRTAFLPLVAIGAWFALMIGLGPSA